MKILKQFFGIMILIGAPACLFWAGQKMGELSVKIGSLSTDTLVNELIERGVFLDEFFDKNPEVAISWREEEPIIVEDVGIIILPISLDK